MKQTNLFSRPIFHILLIITIISIVYSNTLEAPFVFDDKFVIVENPIVKDLGYMVNPSEAKVHNKGHFEYESFRRRYIGYLTFAINYWFHKLDVTGYHLVNIAIHIINSLIVYWLVILTFKTPFLNSSVLGGRINEIAFFASLFFACHPLQTQAVTYIWQRVTSLSTTFYCLALVFYILWRLTSKKPSSFATQMPILFYFGSVISAVLAMKTKEIAFTLPVVIFLYELMFFEEKIKKRILYITPLLLTMLIIPISLLETEKLKGDLMGNISEVTRQAPNISRMDYLLTQFTVIATYIRLIFFPINQNLDYDFPIYNTFLTPEVFLSFLLLFSIFGLGIYMFLRSRTRNSTYRIIAFGIFWFFITLSVESSFIPLVDVIWEHRVYLPSTGFFIALTIGIFLILNKFGHRKLHRIGVAIIVTVIIMFSVLTYSRNNIWSSEIALWQDNVEKSPQKARPQNNLGLAFYNQGHTEEAIEHYLQALKINPGSEKALNNLGLALNDRGRSEEAIEHYLQALRINPDFEEAHINLGNVLNKQGRTKEAIEHFLHALRINPDSENAHYNLGLALHKQGRTEDATKHYLQALRINPDFEEAHNNLGLALKKNGHIEEAKEHYLQALRINPESEKTHLNLGNILYNQGRTEEAKEHYLQALKKNPESEEAHNNLAILLVHIGNIERAIAYFRKALQINPDYVPAKNNLKKVLMLMEKQKK